MNKISKLSTLFSLCFPIFLSISLQNISLTVDSIMVNQYIDCGTEAIGIASSIINIIGPVFFAIASGVNIYYVQYNATKKYSELKQLTGIGISIILPISLICFLMISFLQNNIIASLVDVNTELGIQTMMYFNIIKFSLFFSPLEMLFTNQFRSLKKPKITLIFAFIQVLTNVICNGIFIFGFNGFLELGMAGAALATLISKIVYIIINYVYSKYIDSPFWGSLKEMFCYKFHLLKKVFFDTIPLMGSEFIFGLSKFVTTKIFLLTGVIGYQAYIIANRITMTFNGLVMAPAQVSGIIMGEAITSEQDEIINKQLHIVRKFLLIICVILGLCIMIISPLMLNLFNVEDINVLNLIYPLILINGGYMLIRVFVASTITMLKAGGDNKFIIVMDSLITMVFILPIMYIMATSHINVLIIASMPIIDMIIKSIIGTLRLRTNKWKNIL